MCVNRENEVLKVQLKKYVGAVQMLKREGSQANDGKPHHTSYRLGVQLLQLALSLFVNVSLSVSLSVVSVLLSLSDYLFLCLLLCITHTHKK